jgi:hypothetical protein
MFFFARSNEEGYRHLLQFTFLASQHKITLEEIKKNHEGLAIIYNGDSNYLFNLHNEKSVEEIATSLSASFKGLGDVYHRLTLHQ